MSTDLNFNSRLAAEIQPELARTLAELRQCLDRFETLSEIFSRDFLKLFDQPETPAGPAMRSLYFVTLANLSGSALANLRYCLDEADLACGQPPSSWSDR